MRKSLLLFGLLIFSINAWGTQQTEALSEKNLPDNDQQKEDSLKTGRKTTAEPIHIASTDPVPNTTQVKTEINTQNANNVSQNNISQKEAANVAPKIAVKDDPNQYAIVPINFFGSQQNQHKNETLNNEKENKISENNIKTVNDNINMIGEQHNGIENNNIKQGLTPNNHISPDSKIQINDNQQLNPQESPDKTKSLNNDKSSIDVKPGQSENKSVASLVVGNLEINAQNVMTDLYPENASILFNHPKNINKFNKYTLQVDFKLNKELCNAILNKDLVAIQNAIFSNGINDTYKAILVECIKDMLENFKQMDDLQMLMDYLNIFGDQATYTPHSSFTSWVNQLQFINDIKGIIAPLIKEENQKEIISPSYELRISMNFNSRGQSEIKVPATKNFSLLKDLKNVEKDIVNIMEEKKRQLQIFGKDLDNIAKKKKIEHELNELRSKIQPELDEINKKIQKLQQANNNTIKLQANNLQKQIADLQNQNTKLQEQVNNKQTELSSLPANAPVRNARNKRPTNNNAARRNTLTQEIDKLNTQINNNKQKIDELNNKASSVKPMKNNSEQEISDLKLKLEEKQKPIADKQKELEQIPVDGGMEKFIESKSKAFDDQIVEKLKEAKKLFK